MTAKYYSIGDIGNSRVFISLELRRRSGFGFYLGRTYNGTVAGCVISFGCGVFLAHIRDDRALYRGEA